MMCDSNNWLDFSGDRDRDVARRIFKGICTIEDRVNNCKIFAGSPALSVVYSFRVFLITAYQNIK